jgi:hypothetical protein
VVGGGIWGRSGRMGVEEGMGQLSKVRKFSLLHRLSSFNVQLWLTTHPPIQIAANGYISSHFPTRSKFDVPLPGLSRTMDIDYGNAGSIREKRCRAVSLGLVECFARDMSRCG